MGQRESGTGNLVPIPWQHGIGRCFRRAIIRSSDCGGQGLPGVPSRPDGKEPGLTGVGGQARDDPEPIL